MESDPIIYFHYLFHSALIIDKFLTLPEPARPVSGGLHQQLFARLLGCESCHSKEALSVKSIGLMASRTLNPYRTDADYHLNDPMLPNARAETSVRVEKILKQADLIIKAGRASTSSPRKP